MAAISLPFAAVWHRRAVAAAPTTLDARRPQPMGNFGVAQPKKTIKTAMADAKEGTLRGRCALDVPTSWLFRVGLFSLAYVPLFGTDKKTASANALKLRAPMSRARRVRRFATRLSRAEDARPLPRQRCVCSDAAAAAAGEPAGTPCTLRPRRAPCARARWRSSRGEGIHGPARTALPARASPWSPTRIWSLWTAAGGGGRRRRPSSRRPAPPKRATSAVVHFVDASGETHCPPQTLARILVAARAFAHRTRGRPLARVPRRGRATACSTVLLSEGAPSRRASYRSRGQIRRRTAKRP